MRIVENSPARLKLRQQTAWLSVVLFCIACFPAVAVGVNPGTLTAGGTFCVFALLALHVSVVTFDKIGRNCEILRLDIARLRRRRIGFDEIEDVRVDIGMSGNDMQIVSGRLMLVTAQGEWPFAAGFAGTVAQNNALRDVVLEMLTTDGAALRPDWKGPGPP